MEKNVHYALTPLPHTRHNQQQVLSSGQREVDFLKSLHGRLEKGTPDEIQRARGAVQARIRTLGDR